MKTFSEKNLISLGGLDPQIRSRFGRLLLLAWVTLFSAGAISAAEAHKAYQGSAEFERMKGLVGKWKGKTDMGGGTKEMTVEYRLISGGSAIEERIFAGTPEEMVTIYYDKNGKLALTHYCMLANQPAMLLKSADAKTIHFDFDPSCGLDANSQMHMHSLSITFDESDSITQEWKLYDKGEAKHSHPFSLKRVKT